jgi:hypothetical protein
MKKHILSAIAIATSFAFSACQKQKVFVGSGTITSKSQELGTFTDIEIENGCNIKVVAASTNKVEFSDHENIVQLLKFEVVGTKVVIKNTENVLSISNSKAKAKVLTLAH